jgi:hypothetical protein
MDYSDNDLLAMAFTMLREAHACAPKPLEWLDNNSAMALFRERVKDNPYCVPDEEIVPDPQVEDETLGDTGQDDDPEAYAD